MNRLKATGLVNALLRRLAERVGRRAAIAVGAGGGRFGRAGGLVRLAEPVPNASTRTWRSRPATSAVVRRWVEQHGAAATPIAAQRSARRVRERWPRALVGAGAGKTCRQAGTPGATGADPGWRFACSVDKAKASTAWSGCGGGAQSAAMLACWPGDRRGGPAWTGGPTCELRRGRAVPAEVRDPYERGFDSASSTRRAATPACLAAPGGGIAGRPRASRSSCSVDHRPNVAARGPVVMLATGVAPSSRRKPASSRVHRTSRSPGRSTTVLAPAIARRFVQRDRRYMRLTSSIPAL